MNDNESAPIAVNERTNKGARRLSLPLHVPYLLYVGTTNIGAIACTIPDWIAAGSVPYEKNPVKRTDQPSTNDG